MKLSRWHVERRGATLAEVMVAVALLAGIGVAMMSLISTGAQIGARAGEMQMACMVGERVMDRLVAIGHRGLAWKLKKGKGEGTLDLSALDPGQRRWGRKRRRRGGEGGPEGFGPGTEGGPGLDGLPQIPGLPGIPGAPPPGSPGTTPPGNQIVAPATQPKIGPVFQTRIGPVFQAAPGAVYAQEAPGDGEGEGRGRWGREGRGGRGRWGDPNAGDKLAPETKESRTLTIDNYVYGGTYKLSPADTGLIRVAIKITWERYGVVVPTSPGSLELVRFVADPLLSMGGTSGSGAGPSPVVR